jgi:hypothetical protein
VGYNALGGMDLKKMSFEDFLKLKKLVYRSARPLEFTMWKCVFENGSAEDFFGVLSAYQNEDGGFGHNIEANLWKSVAAGICINRLKKRERTHRVESEQWSRIIPFREIQNKIMEV